MLDDSRVPTPDDLRRAHEAYVAGEPRDLFYRLSRYLVEAAFAGTGTYSLSESVNVLLFTYNRRYYNRHHPADRGYWTALENTLRVHRTQIEACRSRSIDSFSRTRDAGLMPMFRDFAAVLGAVGVAKALHVLAPTFFPLWDNKIANEYGIWLGYVGKAESGFWWGRYTDFMEIRYRQVAALGSAVSLPLKALDEWDYMRVTRGHGDL
jgi:hypothetical protein